MEVLCTGHAPSVPPYPLPGGGELSMWKQTPVSSPPPGQRLMAQGGLGFKSGWSYEVLLYPWLAPSSPGPRS